MQKKTLVVYYSRTGTTEMLAQSIISLTGADSEPLIDTKDRSGLRGYLRAGHDAARKHATVIQLPQYNPAEYDVMYLGTPVRDFGMACAMRTYLERYRTKFPAEIHFFCTMQREGAREVFQEMSLFSTRKPHFTISYTKKDILSGAYLETLRATILS